jgi:DNA modification methylase
VDRLLEDAVIHLVNTDPPFNVRVEPRSNNAIAAGLSSFEAQGKAAGGKLRAKDRPLANDFVSETEFDRLLHAWFGNLARALQPGRGFYIWGGYSNCGNYPPVLKVHELYFSQGIVWIKEHPVLTRKDFLGNFELAFYGWKLGAGHHVLVPLVEQAIRQAADPAVRRWLQLLLRSRDRAGLAPGSVEAGTPAGIGVRPV